jgi:hypothetical protein
MFRCLNWLEQGAGVGSEAQMSQGIWYPGVESESAISSSVMYSSIVSNSGEDR